MLGLPWAFFPRPLLQKRNLGAWGEREAARFLRRKHYRILLRNVRIGGGEIDLVCRDGSVLVFVEVKTRSSTSHGEPCEAVDPGKRARLVRAAYAYLEELGRDEVTYRFDIVEVLAQGSGKPILRHLPDAFGPPGS
ncbi:YraN family protein [Methylacidimicrobium sp. B4]|uniref:YraN family protein n=1 Tax=Methylacidimicrobium sp. B4 TaxID=2796139 RepID=UPI001A8F0D53|nr:YraN family protein [Methylacidimicrobium sp. B4]QSR85498.1 YraN family protein [Methylacidimicrobium sp. B4]